MKANVFSISECRTSLLATQMRPLFVLEKKAPQWLLKIILLRLGEKGTPDHANILTNRTLRHPTLLLLLLLNPSFYSNRFKVFSL